MAPLHLHCLPRILMTNKITDNVIEFPQLSEIDKQYLAMEKQTAAIREQEQRIAKLIAGNIDPDDPTSSI